MGKGNVVLIIVENNNNDNNKIYFIMVCSLLNVLGRENFFKLDGKRISFLMNEYCVCI